MTEIKCTPLYYLLIIFLLVNSIKCKSYYPVVIIHGVLTGSDSMEQISSRIQEVI